MGGLRFRKKIARTFEPGKIHVSKMDDSIEAKKVVKKQPKKEKE